MTEDLQYVGGSYPVHDVAQKVTGELVYGSDFSVPGMLHAKLVLSTVPHGMVRRVDASRAEALPGVVKVFSCFNSPMDRFCRARIHPGQDLAPHDETLPFSEHVRFVGDRVAAVVATSRATAEAAAALVEVEYDELPALFTIDDALGSDVLIHSTGNVAYEEPDRQGRAPGPRGPWIVSSSTSTPRVHHAALEPHVCIAQGHSTGGMTVWTTSQGVYAARTVIAELLGLEYHRVRVIKVPMGGSFGGKTEYIIEPVCAYPRARHAQARQAPARPRGSAWSRRWSALPPGRRIRTACTPDGTLLDFEAATTLDSGAYASSTPDYSIHMCKKVTKVYRVPHYQHQGRAVLTNTPVGGAARGWGAPEMAAATEIHMDRVAAALRLDPVDLRLKNMVEPFDTDLVTGLPLGDARVRECLERGAVAFDWTARRARPAGRGRMRRGVGVAAGAHKNGMFGVFPEASNMSLKMNEDGTFELNASLHEVGCGVVTTMKVIVAEVLASTPTASPRARRTQRPLRSTTAPTAAASPTWSERAPARSRRRSSNASSRPPPSCSRSRSCTCSRGTVPCACSTTPTARSPTATSRA